MKTPKAPKARWGQIGKGGKAASSMKKPKARGISPSGQSYGILNTSKGNVESLAARANGLFGISRKTPTGQDKLTSKVKRQAY